MGRWSHESRSPGMPSEEVGLADSAKDPSHTEPPSYADVPWTTVLEVPGSSRAVLEFEPATYGFACLFLGDATRAVPAATGFTVAAP